MTNLLQDCRFSLPLKKYHISKFERIDSENFESVKVKTSDHLDQIGVIHDESYLDRGVLSLKQYYALIVVDPSNAHAMSITVDPFWHSHILYTEQYLQFCRDLVGETIHHYPLNRKSVSQMKAVRPLSNYTLEMVRKIFENVDINFWPEPHTNADVICVDPCMQPSIFSEDIYCNKLFDKDNLVFRHGTNYRNAVLAHH